MTVDEEACTLLAACCVGEGVAAIDGEVDALAVVDVDGGAIGVVEREAVEVHIALVFSVHVE